MHAINTLALALAAFTATAFAAPHGGEERYPSDKGNKDSYNYTIKELQEQCNNNNFGHGKLSCCNTKGVTFDKRGLLDLHEIFDDILGTCAQFNVLNIALGGDVNNVHEVCPNQVACCPSGSKVSVPEQNVKLY